MPCLSPRICTSTWRARSDQLLEIDLVLAEGGLGLAPRLRAPRDQLVLASRIGAHAAPAAAPGGLEHHRIADLARRACVISSGSSGSGSVAGMTGTPTAMREVARRDLVAERAHGLGPRADEGDAGLGAGLGEFRAFRQEAVAGMDGIRAWQSWRRG